MSYKKNESTLKTAVHSLLFLTRVSRHDLLSTESDNIPSLQSLLWAKLISVPQRSTIFGKSLDDKYLFKDDRFSYNLLPYWVTLHSVCLNFNNYMISLAWHSSNRQVSTIHIELSGFIGMTLNVGASLNFINFHPFQLKYIIVMYSLKIV